MGLPNKAIAEALYIQGQDYMIDNYYKDVVLFFPAKLVPAPTSPSQVEGPHSMFDGESSLDPSNNFWANTNVPLIQQRDTKSVKFLCTLNPHTYMGKFKSNPDTSIRFRNELTYAYTKGYLTEVANIINCDYALFKMPEILDMKFRLLSQPMDHNSIAQGRYFTCWWEQI